jgi:hypothetical protein
VPPAGEIEVTGFVKAGVFSCIGKVAFDSFTLAVGVLKRTARTRRSRQPYHCINCGKWHLGGDLGRIRAKQVKARKERLENERE